MMLQVRRQAEYDIEYVREAFTEVERRQHGGCQRCCHKGCCYTEAGGRMMQRRSEGQQRALSQDTKDAEEIAV